MDLGKKTILCFIASLSAGGAERQMIELIKILHSQGFNVELLTYAGIDQYKCPDYVKRHHVKCKIKFLLPLYLIYFMCRIRFDCCISFLTKNNMIACVAMCFLPGRKLIVGERNCSRNLTRIKKYAYQMYRIADYVVPNSESEAIFIRTHAPWLSKKTIAIQNYTDIERNKPHIKEPNGKIDVGIFARYSKQKNPIYLAKVDKSLRDMGYMNIIFHWYGNTRLNMLGEGCCVSEEFLEIETYIKENNLTDSFILNDFVNDTTIMMANMDVICLSSFYEGYPNAISEGMSCGKVIIASQVSDIPLIVEDGINGFLFNPTDLESGIQAFVRYCNMSDEEKSNMARRNREKALRLFSKEKFTEKYLHLINN